MILIIYIAHVSRAELHSFGTLIRPVRCDFHYQTHNQWTWTFIIKDICLNMVQEWATTVVGCFCILHNMYDYCFYLWCYL
ncbi:hypothetical protein HanIR_Chr02g0083511 [Helianthus annuus]|nr:hypothetical protein HanIR_Chr02g0083511 [Helianthus annuus]